MSRQCFVLDLRFLQALNFGELQIKWGRDGNFWEAEQLRRDRALGEELPLNQVRLWTLNGELKSEAPRGLDPSSITH